MPFPCSIRAIPHTQTHFLSLTVTEPLNGIATIYGLLAFCAFISQALLTSIACKIISLFY